MYRSWLASLLSTLFFLLCNPRLLSASPINPPGDTANRLYPSNPPPSTNPTDLTALNLVRCFLDDINPDPDDCAVAIGGGVLSPDPPTDIHKFYDWSYVRGLANFALPDDGYWRHKTCAVAVRNQDKQQVGSFSLDEVGITAKAVLEDCVGDVDGTPPRQGKDKGGFSKVGTRARGFYVVVYGVTYRPGDGDGNGNGTAGGTVQRVPVPGDQAVDVTR